VKNIQNFGEYILVLVLEKFICALPWSWALAFGRGLGRFSYSVLAIRKKVACDNLQKAFPEKDQTEIDDIARQNYLHFGQAIIEFLRMPTMSAAYFQEKIRFVPNDFVAGILQQPCGAICLSGHFGNWELLAASLAQAGIAMIGVAKEQRNHLVDRMIARNRRQLGIETVPTGMAVRAVVKALKQNKFIALLGDQDAHREGVFVNFMGRPSSTAPGPASLALKTGAPIIFGAIVRGENGRHTAYLERVDFSDLSSDSPENIKILTQRHAALLEKYIRHWPEQWFWMHKRWKTKPDES
jgi:Kdo2-lipid IVA lauroyltransferase/acyltransferase